MTKKIILTIILICFVFFLFAPAFADEGMWTLDNPPITQLQSKYGFTPAAEWLEKVRLASVRFNDGGSGSFITSTGLVLTNHHVAVGQLQKMSSAEKDYVKDGFYAKTTSEEIKSPDLEINVLVSMENVTGIINKAIKDLPAEKALKARQASIARITKEKMDKTGLRADVVSLYYGGEYWLYGYKKYRDVRLVFAPEKQVAFFGGDPDNFTYPRYDLDFAIFRVYENDKPVKIENYFKVNPQGAKDGELIFIPGHPGSTKRLMTYAELEFLRDFVQPYRLGKYARTLSALEDYSKKGTEEARRAATMIFSLQNAYKAYLGRQQGLLDKKLMAKFKKEENNFKAKVAANPEFKKEAMSSWDVITKTVKLHEKEFNNLNFHTLQGGKLPGMGRFITQYVVEIKKPDKDRIEGYHESQLDEKKYYFLSPAPVYKDYEETLLADFLKHALKRLGPNDKFIKIALNGKSPDERAKELIQQTNLDDPKFRKALLEGGEEFVKKCGDPLIVLSWQLDPIRRESVKWSEDNLESVMTLNSEKINKIRFKIYGKSAYPDATFTLRLAYGKVAGYPMNGTLAPHKTTFYGLYDRYYSFDKRYPWSLPERYIQAKDKFDLSAPVDFVSTADIIGGNSGSPVINKDAEFVGVVFDGNIESLVGDFIYDDTANRAVSVHSGGIIEVLNKLYGAEDLVKEILNK